VSNRKSTFFISHPDTSQFTLQLVILQFDWMHQFLVMVAQALDSTQTRRYFWAPTSCTILGALMVLGVIQITDQKYRHNNYAVVLLFTGESSPS